MANKLDGKKGAVEASTLVTRTPHVDLDILQVGKPFLNYGAHQLIPEGDLGD